MFGLPDTVDQRGRAAFVEELDQHFPAPKLEFDVPTGTVAK